MDKILTLSSTALCNFAQVLKTHRDFSDIFNLDRALWHSGVKQFIGIDEAGRGPLAGPVVAAAVVLDPERLPYGVNDSKKLSAYKRDGFFDLISAQALAVGVGMVDHERIDQINILNAALEAMRQAVQSLGVFSVLPIVVDGNQTVPGLENYQNILVSGDSRCASVAAASIIAKVTRDRLMTELHTKYPEYGFDQHKGYGTIKHIEALRQLGPSPVHRISFQLKSQRRCS